jgi:hypothetical protein
MSGAAANSAAIKRRSKPQASNNTVNIKSNAQIETAEEEPFRQVITVQDGMRILDKELMSVVKKVDILTTSSEKQISYDASINQCFEKANDTAISCQVKISLLETELEEMRKVMREQDKKINDLIQTSNQAQSLVPYDDDKKDAKKEQEFMLEESV